MPPRDVTVRLGLNSGPFIAGIKSAQAASTGLATNLTKTATTGSRAAGVLGSSYGTVGLIVGATAASMIKNAADFDQAMANVNATGAASQKQMKLLREEALEMGRTTIYSATESAAGMETLLKAGLSAEDVIGGGLKGALNLAAAGTMDLGQASEIASAGMAQFKLSGEDIPHIADLLAAGAGKAQGDVSDLGMALNQVGLVAHGAGYSIEETTGLLAEFANAGLKGSDAGTSLRTFLLRLQAPTGAAAGALKRYGIATRDANGEMLKAPQIANQMQRAFKNKSKAERDAALVTIFGQDAIRGANVLYQDGAKEAQKWADAVDDAGYAADVAAKKNDTLRGDLKKLSNAWGSFSAGEAGGTQGPFRKATQDVTDLLTAMGKLQTFLEQHPLVAGAIDITKSLRNPTTIPQTVGKNVLEAAAAKNTKSDLLKGADKVLGLRVMADIDDVKKKGAEAGKIVDGVQQKKPTQVKADPKPAIGAAKQADKAIDGVKQNSVPKISADASAAINAASAAQQAINNVIGGLANIGRAHGGAIERANGGQISGPGTGTSDSIPAMLSNGEHVLTASDVKKVGGQDAVYRLRAGIQTGILKFASGGPVGMTSNQWALEIARLQADMADNRSQLKTAKGPARRVLELEYIESKAALRRLKGGLSSDYDFGLQSIVDARNAPVSLFGGVSDSPWMRNGGFASQAQQKLTQIKTLAGKLIELRKRGLAGGLIAEIAELGSGQGIAAADALLKSPGEIKQLSAAYSSIQGYNGIIAAAAYQPSSPGGGINVSIKDISFNLKKMSAEFDAVITDKAGKIIDRQHFNSTVGV